MLKFRITNPSGNDSDGWSTTSSTINLTSRILGREKRGRRNSLIIEETGRFSTRRSSVPDEAFISIADSSFGDCVRYNRSTGDMLNESDFESTSTAQTMMDTTTTGTSSFFGQTSNSFLYNSKRLISRGRDFVKQDDLPEVIDETPTYRGFSNFDEITLTEPNEDVISVRGSTTDSGVGGSLASLGSGNAAAGRKPISSFDLVDLGLQSWNPRHFTLPNLRKKRTVAINNRPRGRYKWRYALQFVLAYLSFSMGMRSIVGHSTHIEAGSSSGAFYLVQSLIMVSVGLPLSYLLAVIGQFSGMGSLQSWKMVPSALGIGLGIAAYMSMMAIVNSVTVAHALYYLILSFHRTLPWMSCDPEWKYEKSCNDHGDMSSQQQQMTCEAYDGGCGGQETRPSMLLWRNFVLGQNKTSENAYQDFGYPKWDLLIALHVGWFIVFIFVMKGMKIYSRILYVSGTVPIVILAGLAICFAPYDGSIVVKTFSIELRDLIDLNCWIRAAKASVGSLVTGIGATTCLASYNRTHFKLNHLVPMIILANLILALTSGILMNEFGHDSQGLHAHDITFGLIPQKLVEQATVVPPQLWSGLFFGLIALSELNTMAILTDACVSIIEDSFEIASKSRVLTSSIYCLASFSLGLPFLTSHGVELLERTTSALEASSLILVALGVLIILYGYGLNRLSDNVEVMSGSSVSGLSKLWMAAFLPCALVAIMVSYFNFSDIHDDDDVGDSKISRLHFYGLICLVISLPVFYGLTVLAKASCKGDSIKDLLVASSGWPHETQSRPQFHHHHTASFERYKSRNKVHERSDFAMNEF